MKLFKLSWTRGCTLGGYRIEKKAALWMAIKLSKLSWTRGCTLGGCKIVKKGCTFDGYNIF